MTQYALTLTTCFLFWAATATAQEASTAPAMTAAAKALLAALPADKQAKATMNFDDPARLDWHNIPKPQRKGLQFRDMNAEERKLCLALVRSGLSDTGYGKALKIMSLETNLLVGEKGVVGAPLRDPERYFLTIFGKPADKGTWGWSFEGHHFSLNFVIRDDHVVSDTPSFWGANPATVHTFIPGGPEKGTRTLAQEEQLAFDLLGSLDDGQRAKAIIAEKAPDDYRAAGQPQPPRSPAAGLHAQDMTAAQKKTLLQLLAAYNANLAPELAAARMAEIESNGIEHVYFAWAGATQPGVGHYYRVQGPTFVLELVNIQKDPDGNPANHIHSVWRNLQGDFGVATK